MGAQTQPINPATLARSRRGGGFPHAVGPALTEAERAIAVTDRVSQFAVWLSGILTVVTAVAAGFICLWLDDALAAYVADVPIPFSLDPLLWIALAGFSEGSRIFVEQRACSRVVSQLQQRMLRHVFALGPARLTTQRTGSLLALMTQGAEKIALFRQTYLGSMVGGLLTPLVPIVFMARVIDPVAALIMLLLVPLPPLLVVLFTKISRKTGSSARKARGQLAARYLDAIQGLETLAVNGAAWRMAQELAQAGERNRVSTMQILKSNQRVLFVIDAGFNLVFLTCGVLVATWRFNSGVINGPNAVTLVALTILMLEPMAYIGGFFYIAMGGRANQAGVKKFLGRSVPPKSTTPPRHLTFAPAVSLDNLSFSYQSTTPVLQDVTVEIAAGEHVAIIGPSGHGKTTLVALLTGALQPDSGTISIDNIPADAQTLRNNSALVSQRTWLFTGTVRDNLTMVAPHATDEALWTALTQAKLADEIRNLPAGLDTEIGERGCGLSGGQAQRLSLARAFLTRRRLLVLDEPTSSIDIASEAAIMQTVAELGNDYTVIMVTHRRSSLRGYPRILNLCDATVTEEVSA